MKKVFLLFSMSVLLMISCKNVNTSTTENSYKKKISLNGSWQFLASNEVAETNVLTQDYKQWDTLKVPGNWDTRKRYAEYVGKGYYQKNFKLPTNWQGKQVRLKFGAVYQTAKVWLNGEFLGTHVGGYLPFEFNITQKVKKKEVNSVVVMADNTIKRGAWWAWGGISREVFLEANESVRMVYQHIASVPNFKTKEVAFSIKYKIENNGSSLAKVAIAFRIKDVVKLENKELSIKAGEVKETVIHFTKKLSDVKLWHFDHPNLYQLTSELLIKGKLQDVATDNFGVRKFEVIGEQFYLNNQPVRMNGVNRVHNHPDYGNTEPDHLITQDLLDIKSLGCNFSRLMHAPLSKNILDFCDKNGFLLVEEIPVWGDQDPNSIPNNPLTKQWMKTMIERDFNHPSVVAWSVGNELRNPEGAWSTKALTADQYGYVDSMLDYVAELDTTRLKTYVTITSYRKGEIGTEPYEKVDFISMNSYGNAPVLAEKTHKKFPGKPIFISEIGIGQIGPAPEGGLSDRLVGYLKELKKYPYVTGVSLWSYNDYRSNYKGTPESGFREWGIVSETREKKKAYQQLKDVYEDWEVKEKIKP
ncbi:glycoside hydrolase family 2 protein [Wenyingzhuangia sp. 2_MG-2023]|uniref:glycoside hydrolase family 2 protein n=1 Tax=Wenyingzhuangia sp. 2_MG-2023 TaxID=3062639 RepID=UPI0026E3E06F|nr:glycoside hydrolase family 2 TIM barrel-domain containing protein [Wenyingzhuangia sp. 2_MG-2023]MDO6736354.1 glycoside hydrolase family 2 TIM barrel-domain containing protein [Wenyingzhuangia sp. 2_MG-2023]